MKKQVITLAVALTLLLAAGSAFAQSNAIRASIPFNFIVNKTTLPAGDYVISTMGGAGQTLLIRNAEGKSVKTVNANHVQSSEAATTTKLVFRCYGDRYFLAQVWKRGSDQGRQLPKSQLESEVALDATPHDVVLVAALR